MVESSGGLLVHMLHGTAARGGVPHCAHGIERAREQRRQARVLQPAESHRFVDELQVVGERQRLVQQDLHDG